MSRCGNAVSGGAVILAVGALAVASPAVAQPEQSREARLSLDLRDAEIGAIVGALAEVGAFQVVFDPGVSCRLTLRLQEVRWAVALEQALRACRLGYEAEGRVVRVAPLDRLQREADERRQLAEEEARGRSANRQLLRRRLSYARAAELAPLLQVRLASRARVVFDERTNTLIFVN